MPTSGFTLLISYVCFELLGDDSSKDGVAFLVEMGVIAGVVGIEVFTWNIVFLQTLKDKDDINQKM